MNFNKLFKTEKKLVLISIILSSINLIFYHFGFFKFITKNTDASTLNGVLLLLSFIAVCLLLNTFVFYILLYCFRNVGKWLIIIFFSINSLAIYFINSYSVIIDKSMIGNLLNTNLEESSAFFSYKIILYFIFLGLAPAIYIYKVKVIYPKLKKALIHISVLLVLLVSIAYSQKSNSLWLNEHYKSIGALAMPWSYVLNTPKYYSEQNRKNKKEIILPDVTFENKDKTIVVLVIGESARLQNFSLYGYTKETNPILSKINRIKSYKAESCDTYTRAGVKCMLEHKYTSDLYEPLPNYLHRNGVDVVWRTTNWGEPTIKIDKYRTKDDLSKTCSGDDCDYDGILLSKLKEEIEACIKDKIFIVLHTGTSHGPTYNKKYPEKFNVFTPVCENPELKQCEENKLINAYDNTILYTDYMLAEVIKTLKELPDYKSAMLYVSDHGESLGEEDIYMHGLPKSIAPKQQYEIPFIVWTSENTKAIKKIDNEVLSQHHVFHSVMDFLDITSAIYDEDKSIFE